MNEGIPPILIRYKISRKILQKLPKSRIFYHFKSVNIIFLPRSTYDIDNETKGELITKRKKIPKQEESSEETASEEKVYVFLTVHSFPGSLVFSCSFSNPTPAANNRNHPRLILVSFMASTQVLTNIRSLCYLFVGTTGTRSET